MWTYHAPGISDLMQKFVSVSMQCISYCKIDQSLLSNCCREVASILEVLSISDFTVKSSEKSGWKALGRLYLPWKYRNSISKDLHTLPRFFSALLPTRSCLVSVGRFMTPVSNPRLIGLMSMYAEGPERAKPKLLYSTHSANFIWIHSTSLKGSYWIETAKDA